MEYISVKKFFSIIESEKDKKYCFILGAGASISSGVPSGLEMANMWLNDIRNTKTRNPYEKEIEIRISKLKKMGRNADYNRFRNISYCPDMTETLNDYGQICELRFLLDEEKEREYMQNLLDKKLPYVGYRALAFILTQTQNNIVITTNFDELIETAINDYTDERYTLINHESLADYLLDSTTGRVKIAKIHRDFITRGFTKEEDTRKLRKEWEEPLSTILSQYTPIVIGYSGTDDTLMNLLSNNTTNGIYWCHMIGDLPNKRVTEMVRNKKGKFVEIYEFDHTMVHLANILCPSHLFHQSIKYDYTSKLFAGYFFYSSYDVKKTIRRKGLDKEIKKQYDSVLKRDKIHASVASLILVQIGNNYYHKKNYLKAEKLYKTAIDFEKKYRNYTYVKAMYNRATALSFLDLNKAIIEFDNVINTPDDAPGSNYYQRLAEANYALALFEAKEYNDAEKIVKTALNRRKWDGFLYRLYAHICFFLKYYENAHDAITNAIDCHINENEEACAIRDYHSRGVINYMLDDICAAKEDFYKVIQKGESYKGLAFSTERVKYYINCIENDKIIDRSTINDSMYRCVIN